MLKQVGFCLPILDHILTHRYARSIVQEYNRRHAGPSQLNDYFLNHLPFPKFEPSDRDLFKRVQEEQELRRWGNTCQLVVTVISAIACGILFSAKLLPALSVVLPITFFLNHLVGDYLYKFAGLAHLSLESLWTTEAARLSSYIPKEAKTILDTIFTGRWDLEKLPCKKEGYVYFHLWKDQPPSILISTNQGSLEIAPEKDITSKEWFFILGKIKNPLNTSQEQVNFLKTLLRVGTAFKDSIPWHLGPMETK